MIAIVIAVVNTLPGLRTPLWLDETYTGTISMSRDIPALINWCLHELSGPVYYAIMWLWTKIFGVSDLALRIPSLIFWVLSIAVILKWRNQDADVRYLWAIALLLWFPLSFHGSEARPYPLLILFGTLQTIVFMRLIDEGGLKWATRWSIVTAAICLTHFHAIIISGIQGLIYLVIRHRDLKSTWPAIGLFIPVLVWLWFHLPFLIAFSNPDIAWYQPIEITRFLDLGFWHGTWGNPGSTILLFAMIAWFIWHAVTGREVYTGFHWAVLSAMFATMIVLATALVKPSFAPRYLVPFVPALLLGIATMLAGIRARSYMLFLASAVTLVALGALDIRGRVGAFDFRYGYSLEAASKWLAKNNVSRLAFYWDSETAALSQPWQLGQVGSFFLRRDGWTGPVSVPAYVKSPDIVALALRDLSPQAGDGILFLNVAEPMGTRHPLMKDSVAGGLHCKDFGLGSPAIIACVRSHRSD